MKLSLRLVVAALCGMMLHPVVSIAQQYPSKTVRLLLGYPAGGSLDIVARIVGQQLSEQTGQSFIVDNRPGAGGNLASEAMAKVEPDGYTLMFGATGTVINTTLYLKVAYKLEDFIPISLLGEAPLLLMANVSLPANTLPELIKLAKSKPGAIRFASAGNGSTSHLATEVFRLMANLEMLHVPYKGGGQAFQDVIGGQVEITTLPISESIENVRAKRVKAIGQTGARRSFIAPDIPTLDEQGLKGYAVSTWYVVFGRAKMQQDHVTRLYDELARALKNPATQEKLKKAGVDIIGTTPQQAAAFVKTEYEKWETVITKSGLKIE